MGGKPPSGQNMSTRVQNGNISYKDQKDIMRNIFGHGKMIPSKMNNNMGRGI